MPITLGGVVGPEDPQYEWASRTHFGVAAVHEIKIWRAYISGNVAPAYRKLHEFGYGLDDCKVWRFWDAPQPVAINGGNAKALVLARAGKAMLIVTDFGGGGELRLQPDGKALGLKPDFQARDAETAEVIPVQNGQLSFPIKRHDFRIVHLE